MYIDWPCSYRASDFKYEISTRRLPFQNHWWKKEKPLHICVYGSGRIPSGTVQMWMDWVCIGATRMAGFLPTHTRTLVPHTHTSVPPAAIRGLLRVGALKPERNLSMQDTSAFCAERQFNVACRVRCIERARSVVGRPCADRHRRRDTSRLRHCRRPGDRSRTAARHTIARAALNGAAGRRATHLPARAARFAGHC